LGILILVKLLWNALGDLFLRTYQPAIYMLAENLWNFGDWFCSFLQLSFLLSPHNGSHKYMDPQLHLCLYLFFIFLLVNLDLLKAKGAHLYLLWCLVIMIFLFFFLPLAKCFFFYTSCVPGCTFCF
jgi:hypothetical protein